MSSEVQTWMEGVTTILIAGYNNNSYSRSGNTLYFYNELAALAQMNTDGQIYYYIAIGKPARLISFSIEGTTYQAIEDMAWRDWLKSEYNTDKYVFGPASNINTPDRAHAVYYDISTLSKTYDVIVAGHSYICK